MPTVTIKPGQLGAILKADARKRGAAVTRGIRSAAMRGKAHLIKKSPTGADGHLKQSWEVNSDGKGGYVLENTAPYAGIVERGARPHPVSEEGIEAIRHWVIRKGLVKGRRRRNAAGELAHTEKYERQVEEVVQGIVWKLRHHGQEATFFVRDSLPELEGFLDQEVNRYVDKVGAE